MTGVIFDVDGVLLDSMSIWMHAGEWYLKRKGKVPEDSLGKKLFSMSMSEGANYLKETWNLSESVSDICAEINQLVIDSYKHTIPLKTGVLETLQELKQRNVPMVIATSSDEFVVRSALRRLQIESYFSKVFSCTEIGVGKDQPEIFLAAARYIKSISQEEHKGNSEIYVVEDSLAAAKTAKLAGFSVMGIYDEASSDTWKLLCQVADYTSKELKAERFRNF